MDWKEIAVTIYDRLFGIHEPKNALSFSLGDRPPYESGGERADLPEEQPELAGDQGRAQRLNRGLQAGQEVLTDATRATEDQLDKIIVTSEGLTHRIDAILEKQADSQIPVTDLSSTLDKNLTRIRRVFRTDSNADLIIREFVIPLDPAVRAAVVYMEGLTDKTVINDNILAPLMLLTELKDRPAHKKPLITTMCELLPSHQVKEIKEFDLLVTEILAGNTVVLIDGEHIALTTETKGFEHRGVERTQNEAAVLGPQQAFNESLRANTALVRRILRTPDLTTEMVEVGHLTRTNIGVMYVHGVANPKLVAEVKRRLQAIKVDYVIGGPTIEHYIQDNFLTPVPQVLHTERPDRTAAFLAEGHVAIMVDGSPYGMIVPITFWTLLHTAEDYYTRWQFATFTRILRVTAIVTSLLIPALYVAIVNYHQEMIPTELLLSIAGSREKVPFPAFIEVILMVFSFELIREASVRVPSIIGPTIGIVGAIVIGQAAVAATVVSPILVVVIAITALGNFSIPNYQLSFGVRLFQFIYLLAGAALGFYGIAAVLVAMILHFTGLQNFGVPFTSPVSPYLGPLHDIVIRAPTFDITNRARFLRPGRSQRERIVTRTWDPKAPPPPEQGDGKGDRQ